MLRFQSKPCRIRLFRFARKSDTGRTDVLPVVAADHRLDLLAVLDRTGEGDGPTHRRAIALLRSQALDATLRQAVVDPHDARDIRNIQFAVDGELLLEVRADRALVHRQYEHSVVGQQVAIDCLAEAQAVEGRAEGGLVVHAHQRGILLHCLGAHRLGIDLRGRRHVQAFLCLDGVLIVHAEERRLGLVGESEASRAVRFVAHHQVELGQTGRLGASHDIDRLVSREVHGHAVWRLGLGNFGEQLFGARGRRVGEVRDRIVLVVLADLGIGTDRERAQREASFRRPLLQSLREQCNRRNQEQYRAPGSRHLLRYAQAREGLAGTTGHDELAASAVHEASLDIFQGLHLMLSQLFRLRLDDLVGVGQ